MLKHTELNVLDKNSTNKRLPMDNLDLYFDKKNETNHQTNEILYFIFVSLIFCLIC